MVVRISSIKLQKSIQISIAALLTGCAASLDATKDLNSATSLAQERLPVVVDETLVWHPSQPLSIDAAISYAIMHDAILQRDMAIIVQRRAEIAQSELPASPTFSAAFGIAIDGLSGAPIVMQGMQGLSWLWTRPDRIAAAEQSLQQAILTAANQTVRLVADVRTAHVEVSSNAKLLQFAQQDEQLALEMLEITNQLEIAGEASSSNVDDVVIAFEKSMHATSVKVEALQLSKLRLLKTMGCPEVSTSFTIVPSGFSEPSTDFDEQSLLELAGTNRLDLATKRAAVAQRSSELGFANPPLITGSVAFNENFVDRQAMMTGASITIPLDGDAKEAVADSKLTQAKLSYIDAFRTAKFEVRTALQQFLTAREQATVLDVAIVGASTMKLHRAQIAFDRGELHPLSLIPIQREVVAARMHEIKDILQLAVTGIQLELSVGGTFQGMTQ